MRMCERTFVVVPICKDNNTPHLTTAMQTSTLIIAYNLFASSLNSCGMGLQDPCLYIGIKLYIAKKVPHMFRFSSDSIRSTVWVDNEVILRHGHRGPAIQPSFKELHY